MDYCPRIFIQREFPDRQDAPGGGVDVDTAKPAICRLAAAFAQMGNQHNGAPRPLRDSAELRHQRAHTVDAVHISAPAKTLKRVGNKQFRARLHDRGFDTFIGQRQRVFALVYDIGARTIRAEPLQSRLHRVGVSVLGRLLSRVTLHFTARCIKFPLELFGFSMYNS